MTFLNGTNSSLKTHTTAAVYYVCKWNQNLQNEVVLSHAFCSCRKPHNNNNFPLCSSVFKRLFFANCIISFLFPCLIQYFDLNTYDKTVRMIVSLFCIRLLVFNTYAVGSLASRFLSLSSSRYNKQFCQIIEILLNSHLYWHTELLMLGIICSKSQQFACFESTNALPRQLMLWNVI